MWMWGAVVYAAAPHLEGFGSNCKGGGGGEGWSECGSSWHHLMASGPVVGLVV